MPSDDLMEWLGPAAEDLTAEQIERFTAAARDIAARYPDQDEQPERDAALTATVQYLLGETTPEQVKWELHAARRREREAFVTSVQIAVLLVRDGNEKKGSAERVGVDRMSLKKALGER